MWMWISWSWISWTSIRDACRLAGWVVLVLAAATLMAFVQIFALRLCIDGIRLPACLRQCPPPPSDLEAVRLIYQDDFRTIDGFCARCQLDFPSSFWDEDSIFAEDISDLDDFRVTDSDLALMLTNRTRDY